MKWFQDLGEVVRLCEYTRNHVAGVDVDDFLDVMQNPQDYEDRYQAMLRFESTENWPVQQTDSDGSLLSSLGR